MYAQAIVIILGLTLVVMVLLAYLVGKVSATLQSILLQQSTDSARRKREELEYELHRDKEEKVLKEISAWIAQRSVPVGRGSRPDAG